jgi:DNA (cytosine-5)-methyltransferase 1
VKLSKPNFPQHPDAPWLLDLFCGAGGASVGYWLAGFNVVGVDICPMPRYPFTFVQADALSFQSKYGFEGFSAIHASPPCQAFTHAQRIRQNEHPDFIGLTRERLQRVGLPYVIENVVGAPLEDPLMLCGAMFPDLQTYRHRLFETNFDVKVPPHPPHAHKQTKMGRPPVEGEFIQVVGHFAGVEYARKAMGISWMTRNELKEAIPPAYTRLIGEQLFSGALKSLHRGEMGMPHLANLP